jgi:hypothetical protein
MNAFEAYQRYLAYRQHFTNEKYDIIKYGGKVRASPQSFDKRRDKYFFHKLSKQEDVDKLLTAFFVESNSNKAWIGDILSKKDEYLASWSRRQESLSYIFKEDIRRICEIAGCFDLALHVSKDGSHPPLLVAYLQRKVSIETVIILNDLVNFFPAWNSRIEDYTIWPRVRLLCQKYQPLLKYDKSKMKQIVLEVAHKS